MLIIYSPDGRNVYGSKVGEFDGIGLVLVIDSCEIVVRGASHLLL